MSNLLQSLITGLNATDNLRDPQHASRIFVDGNFFRHPKYAWLFYVVFDYQEDYAALRTSQKNGIQMGALCKTAQLPKFTIDSQVLNAYNRKNIVQRSIKYDPVTLRFHDDSADIIREFWYDYMSFYYRDSEYDPAQYTLNHKYYARSKEGWGYNLRNEFENPSENLRNTSYHPLKAIRIYSLMGKKFSEYMLINPIITSFRHGEHSNEGGTGLLEHEMVITYEQVKYRKGKVSKETLGDSMLLLYDNVQSPGLTGGRSIFGTGGFVETLDNVTNDLANGNWAAALIKINKAQQNFKGQNIGTLLNNEGLTYIQNVVTGGQNSLSTVNAPSIGSATNSLLTSAGGGVFLAAGGTLAVAGAARMLNADGSQATQADGEVRLAEWVEKNVPSDQTLPNYDYRAVSNNDFVSTTAGAPGSTTTGFPRLSQADTLTAAQARNLSQFSVEELTAEIAARFNLNMNDAADLIVATLQGSSEA
jgi:hypothetical protein